MSTSPDSVARTGVPGPHLVCDLIAAPRITIPGVRDRLDNGMRAIIARQGMMFVATSDGSGVCDCTFRAGPPGFARVLDEGKLAWPEGLRESIFDESRRRLQENLVLAVLGLKDGEAVPIARLKDIRSDFKTLSDKLEESANELLPSQYIEAAFPTCVSP